MNDEYRHISLPELISLNRPILIDGAMGTELNSMGISTTLPLWSAGALAKTPEAVFDVHQAYVAAGAQIITANTFRTSTYTYTLAGLSEPAARQSAKRATKTAIKLALKAGQGTALVSGSVPPVADCYTPEDYPGAAVVRKTYGELIPWIAEAGAHLFLLETHINLEEAMIALDIASSTGLPVLVSFLVDSQMQLYSGTPLSTAVQAVESGGASGVLVNCVTLPLANEAVARLKKATSMPFGIYANGGVAQPSVDGLLTELQPEDDFQSAAAMWLKQGCTFIGGCCGTTPAVIAALARQIDDFVDRN